MKHAALIDDVSVGGVGYTLPSTISLPARDAPRRASCSSPGAGRPTATGRRRSCPGTNGSGAQLALALQARGVGSIRFDKVGSGVNMPKSTAPADLKMLDVLSLAHYVDEAEAAFDELASRDGCGGSSCSATAKDRSTRRRRPSRSRRIHASAASSACPGPRARSSTPRSSSSGRSTSRPEATPRSWTRPSRTFAQPCWSRTHQRPICRRSPRRWPVASDALPSAQKVARELIFSDPLAALHAYRGRALVVSAANDAQVPGSDADGIFAALASDAKDKRG